MKTISCIIAAYNECPRISSVLDIVVPCQGISEIIVIDDGSKDNTREIVGEYVKKFPNVKLIVHEKNKGKTMAVYSDIKASTGDYIFLLDADLVGLIVSNITALIDPIQKGEADMSMSMRSNPKYVQWLGIEYISGERIFSRSIALEILGILPHVRGFGLEPCINTYIIKYNCRIKVVFWKNVQNPWPAWKKYGFIAGIKKDIRMNRDILGTISLWEVFYQNYKMIKLKV